MATPINNILEWFKSGKKPTQAQFWATWESFWHKDEKLPQSSILNLSEALNDKANQLQLDDHLADSNAHGLSEKLAGKSDIVHTHVVNDVDGLQDTLNLMTEKIAVNDGLTLIANHAAQEIHLQNGYGDTLATLNVAFLNNEGTTFFYNDVTEMLELRNDTGEVLSQVPVSAFVSNLAKSIAFNGGNPFLLELRDTEGHPISSVTLSIGNVTGLQSYLNGIDDVNLVQYNSINTLQTNKVDTNGGNAIPGSIWNIVSAQSNGLGGVPYEDNPAAVGDISLIMARSLNTSKWIPANAISVKTFLGLDKLNNAKQVVNGGIGATENQVYVGWDGGDLIAQVDNAMLGKLVDGRDQYIEGHKTMLKPLAIQPALVAEHAVRLGQVNDLLGDYVSVAGNQTIYDLKEFSSPVKSNGGFVAPVFKTVANPSYTASRSWSVQGDAQVYGDFAISRQTDIGSGPYVPEMYCSPAGNWGLGTVDPKRTLHVAGSGKFDGVLTLNTDVGMSLGNNYSFLYSATEGGINFRKDDVLDGLIFIEDVSHNVGIGTKRPQEKLHVIGNAKIDGYIITPGVSVSSVDFPNNGASTNSKLWQIVNNYSNHGSLDFCVRKDINSPVLRVFGFNYLGEANFTNPVLVPSGIVNDHAINLGQLKAYNQTTEWENIAFTPPADSGITMNVCRMRLKDGLVLINLECTKSGGISSGGISIPMNPIIDSEKIFYQNLNNYAQIVDKGIYGVILQPDKLTLQIIANQNGSVKMSCALPIAKSIYN